MIAGAGAGRQSLEEAFESLYAKPLTIEPHRLSGRTDRGIGLELLREHEVTQPEHEERELRRFFDAYLERLPKRLSLAPGRILPGVVPILESLQKHQNAALGLLTGNMKEGANHKLRALGLDRWFAFGGYGDFHEHRDDVAREALASAHQVVANPSEIWVIGDTPLDIQCARAIGARVLAVATGSHPLEELAAHQPDQLLEDLAKVEAVCDLLLHG